MIVFVPCLNGSYRELSTEYNYGVLKNHEFHQIQGNTYFMFDDCLWYRLRSPPSDRVICYFGDRSSQETAFSGWSYKDYSPINIWTGELLAR